MSHRYLDPDVLARMSRIELAARSIVEGSTSGRHKSPYHGFSVEFAEHREYVPGDDIKHVDWKVYGRTERIYLKQYEEETNLICWLVVDVSESMKFGSAAGHTKFDHAALAAAALAYLVLQQQDSVGLVTFDDRVRAFLRPTSQPSNLKEIAAVLAQGPGASPSRLGAVLHELAERIPRRGLIFVLSDFFDEVPDVLAGVRHLRFKRHEVVAAQVLDPAEVEFPFQEATLFRGLEQIPELLADPRGLRKTYLDRFNAFVEELGQGCRSQQVDFLRLRTDHPLERALPNYLARRQLGRRA